MSDQMETRAGILALPVDGVGVAPQWGQGPSGDRAAWDLWIRRAQLNRTDLLANQFLLVPKKKSWASGDGKEAGGHQVQCAPFPDGEPRAHSPGAH